MAEIQFVAGNFLKFKAITKVHLGKLGLDLPEGETFEFDGQTLRFRGVDHVYAEMRAAARVGWVTLLGEAGTYQPQPAGVRIRSAQNPEKGKQIAVTVEDDSTDAGPATRQKAVSEPQPRLSSAEKKFSREVKDEDALGVDLGSRKKMGVQRDAAEDQDAKPVAKVNTPAIQQKVVVTETTKVDDSSATRTTKKATSSVVDSESMVVSRVSRTPSRVSVLESTQGDEVLGAESERVEDIIGVLDPQERARLLAEQRKAAVARAEASDRAATSTQTSATLMDALEEFEASMLKSTKITKSPPMRSPQTIEEVVMQGDDIDLGDGLVWDKTLHWRTRAKIATEKYGSNPKALAAIRAIESPAVNTLIMERLQALSDD